MKQLKYNLQTPLEKFGAKIFNLLVDNFPQTFYVGGMPRDLLLHRRITDIDLATEARPDEIIKIFRDAKVRADTEHKQFGIITAFNKNYRIEIATFRRDSYGNNRYPKVAFVKTPKQDSLRRDFTVNALYFSPKTGKILDFHGGFEDLKIRRLKFIGNPIKRIKEDPLRIVRAIRFALQLHFKFEAKTDLAIEKNLFLLKQLTVARTQAELDKILDAGKKQIAHAAINHKKLLDK